MIDKLLEGLNGLGIKASEDRLTKLELYINELELWNSRLNLVSVDDREQLIVRHILDCLAGLNIINSLPGERLADIGSGAGLPGMLLAIFMEDRHFTLVERSGKKAGFLRSSAALLGLVGRVNVIDADLKDVKDRFNIVCLRAFRDFGDFYPGLKAVTEENGTIAAYKGRKSTITSDLDAAGVDLQDVRVEQLKVPFLEEERHLMLVKPRS